MRVILALCLLLSALPATASDTVIRALDATLVLYSADGRERFLGSAFAYRRGDRVVSNAHVVGRAGEVIAVARDGRRYRAQVVQVDTARDLAELRLDRPHDTWLEPAEGAVAEGQGVLAAGAPLEATFTLTAGIVSAAARQIDPQQPVAYLQHSAPVNPGSSGGPLVDAAGRLLGVNTRIADGSRFFAGIAYAVPRADLDAFLDHGPVAAGRNPGFTVRDLSAPIRAALGAGDTDGVLIDNVVGGSAAAAAGLRPGDILRAMGEHRIAKAGDIAFALAALPEVYTLSVRRGGAALTLEVEPVARSRAIEPMTPVRPARRDSYSLAEMGISADADGTITSMGDSGAGFFAGLSRGDVILAVNGLPVAERTPDWATRLRIENPVLLLVRLSDGATRHYLLDPWDTGAGLRPSSAANVMDQEVVGFD